MSHRNNRRAGGRIRSRVAVIVAGAALLSWAGPGANAFWTASSIGGTAAAAADAVAAGATPSTSVSAGNVTLAWNASTTLAGRPVTGYTVARYSSASGGTKIPAGGSCAAQPIAGLGCTDQGVPTGTWYYTVTPVLAQWTGTESARSAGAAVDTTPPGAPGISVPPFVNTGNVTAVPVSGTTEPGASIALTITDAGAAHTVTKTVTANSSGAWNTTLSLTGLDAGTITYRAVATDTAGNPGTVPGIATSTKDVTAPTVTAVALADSAGPGKDDGLMEPNDTATITFSEALDASTICSDWAAGASGTLKGNNDVTVTISSRNVLTVAVNSSACATSRIGTVGLGAGTAYGPATGTATYKGNGSNASTVSWDASTKKLTITLGALVQGTPNGTEQLAAAPSYTPPDGMKDRAGNSLAITPFTSPTTSRF
ncbi:hypothetical protein [Arthrobacter sp. 9MFCol3.1]|uniref:hypothetical protein n=1 Tax=Arthrobacter sp. 9MFCol3.1 TaxID=1150398 RepID=UPI00047C3672|nr:hypothetical protein [Arthrobacter sp. 9MFCol3.1]